MKYIICLLCAFLCVWGCTGLCLADGGSDEFYDEEVSFIDRADEGDSEVCTMYVVGVPYVRLRQNDSIEKPYLDKMPYGSMVTVLNTQTNELGENWSLVIYNDQYGYCMTEYLSSEIEVTASERHPSSMEEAFGTTLLQRGNKTPSYLVKNLQLCLIKAGFLNDDADGYFGKNTYKALSAFQKSQGLDPVGCAGKTSKTRLWYLYADYLLQYGVMQ